MAIDMKALFEDNEDLFEGTPESRYWDIHGQLSDEIVQHDFDEIMTKIAAMEKMLMEYYDEEALDSVVKTYIATESMAVEDHKKSLYMEYAANLIFKIPE